MQANSRSLCFWSVSLAVWTAVGTLRAAEVGVPAELLSAYVFRGETRNPGAVLQPAVEISDLAAEDLALRWTLGVWGNLDLADDDGRLQQGEFSEVDLYLTAHLPLPVKPLSIHAGYWEYLFPGREHVLTTATGEEETLSGDANREVSIGLAADCLLNPGLTVYYGVGGDVEADLYGELDLYQEYALTPDLGLSCGARLGYQRNDAGADGFKHLTLSVGCYWRVLNLGLDYIRALDDDVLADASDGGPYDVELVGRAGIVYRF
ncbi:MAG: hypothetical protein PHR35_08185 [Kiritimatiellae bacterium]|nr:hypothetical protein [Kiritimatiellia bacterium]